MGHARTTSALALLALALARPAAGAQSTSFEFLRLDAGPRQVGMGAVGAGAPLDVYSAIYNPAWAARLGSQELAFSHASWIGDMSYDDLLYAYPSRHGAFAARLQSLGYGSIDGYDSTGAASAGVKAYSRQAAASYASALPLPRAYAGATARVAQESLGNAKAQTFAGDLGFGWFPFADARLETLSLGAAVRHLGAKPKFDRDAASLPRTIDLGASMHWLDRSLTAALDFHLPAGRSPYAAVGGEYWLQQQVAVRVGFEPGQDEGPGLRAGVGLRLSRFEANYAFAPMGDLGMSHHIGLIWRFGSRADRSFRDGLALMEGNKPAEAIIKFNQALQEDPRHPEAGIWLRRAYRRIRDAVREAK